MLWPVQRYLARLGRLRHRIDAPDDIIMLEKTIACVPSLSQPPFTEIYVRTATSRRRERPRTSCHCGPGTEGYAQTSRVGKLDFERCFQERIVSRIRVVSHRCFADVGCCI